MIKKKILYFVEAFGGGVFTYICNLANALCEEYDVYVAYGIRKQTPSNFKNYFDSRVHLICVENYQREISIKSDLAALKEMKSIAKIVQHTSCDKGTVERHNGLIRRFIPKGDCINNYSLQQIIDIETWCNSLPRKILAYHTPDEIFERELDLIYQAA